MEINPSSFPGGALNTRNLQVFFITHLNSIYCVKSHLQERLPELCIQVQFTDLAKAIAETLADVEKQIYSIDQIYLFLNIKPDFDSCKSITRLIEDTFNTICEERYDPEMRDLAILSYLQQIKSIEMSSFKMLSLATPFIKEKKIRQMLGERFDEDSKDPALLRLITAKYFGK